MAASVGLDQLTMTAAIPAVSTMLNLPDLYALASRLGSARRF